MMYTQQYGGVRETIPGPVLKILRTNRHILIRALTLYIDQCLINWGPKVVSIVVFVYHNVTTERLNLGFHTPFGIC